VPPQATAVRSPPLKAIERERNVNARGEGKFMALMSYRIPGGSQCDRTAGLAELTRYYLSPSGSARALALRLVHLVPRGLPFSRVSSVRDAQIRVARVTESCATFRTHGGAVMHHTSWFVRSVTDLARQVGQYSRIAAQAQP